MSYEPPSGYKIGLTFVNGYVVPAGYKVGLEFSPSDDPVGDTKYLLPEGVSTALYGETYIWRTEFVSVAGVDALAISNQHKTALGTRYIVTNGVSAHPVGKPNVRNWNYQAFPSGIQSLLINKPYIWNTRQYITNGGRFKSDEYGNAYVQGGVKHLSVRGFSSLSTGRPVAVNTTADQHITRITLQSTLSFGLHDFQPYTLWAIGFNTFRSGNGYIQHTPTPKGWVSEAYGQASIEFSLKTLTTSGLDNFVTGYPQIRDRAQKLFHSAAQQRSTIFGDTRARLSSLRVSIEGFNTLELSDWASISNTRRFYALSGINAGFFGNLEITNKTPSLFPLGLDATTYGDTFVAYSTRFIYQKESESHLGVGKPTLKKTPSIAPKGFEGSVGLQWISFYERELNLDKKGFDAARVSVDDATLTHKRRFVTIEDGKGFRQDAYGKPVLTHEVRTVEAKGASFAVLSTRTWVSYGLRGLEVKPIEPLPVSTLHMIGGSRSVAPDGFDATEWLTRIIPHSQSVYSLGFANEYGWPTVGNYKRYPKPFGFSSEDSIGYRWGRSYVWNSRQVVVQSFAADNGLYPPAISTWHNIVNRDRLVSPTGSDFQKFGNQHPLHNARLIEPNGKDFLKTSLTNITYWQRTALAESWDSLAVPRWAVVFNIADLIHSTGFDPLAIGVEHSLSNRSRKYDRVGGFETYSFGNAFIADAVRNIVPRQLHSIQPPRIEMPTVDHYTKYIEDINGRDLLSVSLPFIREHWNKITTRWAFHPPAFVGEPVLKNLTPELRAYGRNFEEYGTASARTEWREVYQFGDEAARFGVNTIRDSKSWVFPKSFGGYRVGLSKLIRIGGVPDNQFILARGLEHDGKYFGRAFVGAQEALTEGFNSNKFGETLLYANSIRVEPGIGERKHGTQKIYNKNQVIVVGSSSNPEAPPSPILSPHLIFGPNERPPGYKAPPGAHYVDMDTGGRSIKGIGRNVRVNHYHRNLKVSGLAAPDSHSSGRATPAIRNTKFFIDTKSLQALRLGYPKLLPHNITAKHYQSSDTAAIGRAKAERAPYTGPQDIKNISKMDFLSFGVSRVELLHRKLIAKGSDLMVAGTGSGSDTPYMWQRLRVGELMPTIPKGFNSEAYSDHWISLGVRQVCAEGFDASNTDSYDFEGFEGRMKVFTPPETIPKQLLQQKGSYMSLYGIPNIQNKAHHIRPDGNAEQYRKGVQHA